MPRISIRFQLLALVAAVAVPLAALLAYTIYSNSRQAVAEVKANAHVLAVVAASDVSRILAANRDVLKQIAKRPVIRKVDSKNCDPVLWDFMGMFPKSANMTVINMEGLAICSAVPQPGGKPVNVSKAEWFKRSQETDGFVVGKPFFGPITGRWVTVLTYPIHDDAGKKIGYLGLPLDLALYEPNLSGAPLFPGSTVGIVTADMKMVWRNIDPEKWVGKDINGLGVARQLVNMKSGEMEGAGLDGVPRIYSITPIEGLDWFAYVGIPSDSVYSRVRASLARSIFLGTISLLGLFGLALFIASRIQKPVQALVDTARAVKNGNNEIRARLEGAPEIVEVAEEFNEMLDVRFLAEAAMMKSEIELSEALKIARLGYWEYDVASGNFIFNDQYYSLHHTTAAAMGGYRMSAADFASKLVHSEDVSGLGLHIQKALDAQDAGFYAETETRILCADGEIRWVLIRFRIEKDEYGKTIKLIGTNQDITERKKAEEELHLMNERFVMATRAGQIGVWDWDIPKNELLWDNSMYRLYGIPEGTFGGAYDAWTSTIHPQDKAYTEGEIQAALRGEREYAPEFRIIRPDGVIRYLKADSQTFHDEKGKPLRMIGTNIDITERKRMEEALAVSEQEFRSLAESSPDFIIRYDLKHRMRYLNRALVRFLGLATADEVIGKQPINVWPDGRFAIIDEVAARVIKSGNTETMESMMPAETGEYRFHQIRVVAERDVAGQIIGTIALGRDITERRGMEEEIRKLNQELEQRVAERTEQLQAANQELEAFSYSVSHDLRTPLRAIDGFSHILLEDYACKLDDEGKRLLNVVRNNTNRMGQLIDDMLKFSRTGRLELNLAEIDMEQLAYAVYEELKPMVSNNNLQLEIAPLPSVQGDSAMLRQVFVNLLSNAIKFSRKRETPHIKVGAEVKDGEIVYYVKDNGAGFDMQFADKLFGVFQRLHSVNEFEGTGIGLAIVKRIINRHGGRVWAESRINEGATLYFSLPFAHPQGDDANRGNANAQ